MSELYLGDQLITPVVIETVIAEGASDYNDLDNKPAINDVELIGDKTLDELGIQPKGDYALKSEIPNISNLASKDEIPTRVSELENDSNYATQTQVMQAIASIPQFKLSIVNELPLAGEKMTLYLVPKEGTDNDVYNEYIWIEETTSFEFLGTTAVDLTDYVKNTDYATIHKAGLVQAFSSNAFSITDGKPICMPKTLDEYTKYPYGNMFIGKGTLENIKNDFVKRAVTENDIELTDDEKTSARTWLGAVGSTDYANSNVGGVLKVASQYYTVISSSGYLTGSTITLDNYDTANVRAFISKGTLDNVLAQYSKTVLTTEADYNALETKDANTLYLIEE